MENLNKKVGEVRAKKAMEEIIDNKIAGLWDSYKKAYNFYITTGLIDLFKEVIEESEQLWRELCDKRGAVMASIKEIERRCEEPYSSEVYNFLGVLGNCRHILFKKLSYLSTIQKTFKYVKGS